MVSAFQYLQEKNIAHRDIKPENILLDKDGNAIVSDTGGAITIGSSYKNDNMHGTFHYFSPELERLWVLN